jgi:NodT family efflux transporter outer membrane factor (OMF) lipoprotein
MKRWNLLFFFLLSGCMVGPDYITPSIDVPEKWTNASHGSKNIKEDVQWWKNYKDPILTSLIQETLESNYDLKGAFAAICAARASLMGADAELTPQINMAGSVMMNAISLNQPFVNFSSTTIPTPIIRFYDLYNIGLTTSWEIDLFGRLRRGVEAATATVESTIDTMQGTLLSLVADVALNYITLRSYQQQLEITQKLIVSWESMLELNKDLLKAGLITQIDVENTRSSYEQAKASIPPLKAHIKTTIHQLSILIGKPPASLYSRLIPVRPIPEIPVEIFAGLPSELLKRRPDIRAAERTLAASSAQIGVVEGSLFPIFSLTGPIAYQSNILSTLLSPASGMYMFGPSVTAPIVNFGRIRSQIDAATAFRDENIYKYKSTVLKALADVENSLVNYAFETKRYYDLKQASEAVKRAADVNTVRFDAGFITFLSVLQADITYQMTALMKIQSQTTLALNSVALYKALGGGLAARWSSVCAVNRYKLLTTVRADDFTVRAQIKVDGGVS